MATAKLENNNKFAYLGLRRKPTYDELIGLINENASLFGPAPDRRATAFKASPEGSFFDGLNYTDRLKEEQERILNKGMRDILLRQNMGNQTISVARLQNNPSTPSSNTGSLPQQVSLNEGLIQEQLQQRAQQAIQRSQQTGEAHQNMLSQMGRLPILSRLANLTPTSRQTARTQMRTAQQLATSTDDEPELMTDAEMQTARGEMQTARGEMQTAREQPSESDITILNSLKFRNPMASEKQLTSAMNVLSNVKNLKPEQIATTFTNFSTLNNIYATLADNGFIPSEVWEEYQSITTQISRERGGSKRARFLGELANHYRDNIYDKFINEIANRPSGSMA